MSQAPDSSALPRCSTDSNYVSGQPRQSRVNQPGWNHYWPHDFDAISCLPGVYVIYDDGVPCYIGQSDRVRDRLLRGHRIAHKTPRIRILGVLSVKVRYDKRYGECLMREARLIRRLRPRENRRGHDMAAVTRGRQLVCGTPLRPLEVPDVWER